MADLTDADLVAVARATPIHRDICRAVPVAWMRAAIAADRERNAVAAAPAPQAVNAPPPGMPSWRDRWLAAGKVAAAETAQPEPAAVPVGVLIRGEGGAWSFSCGDNLLAIYAMPPGEHSLYATPQPPAPVPAVPLTDEQILACVRSIGVPVPMGLTRDRGPYEVTEPTWFLTQLVRAIERAHGITGGPEHG